MTTATFHILDQVAWRDPTVLKQIVDKWNSHFDLVDQDSKNYQQDVVRELLLSVYRPFLDCVDSNSTAPQARQSLKEIWRVDCDVKVDDGGVYYLTNFRVAEPSSGLRVLRKTPSSIIGLAIELDQTKLSSSLTKNEDFFGDPMEFATQSSTILAVIDLTTSDSDLLKAINYWRDVKNVALPRDSRNRRKSSGRKDGSVRVERHALATLISLQLGHTIEDVHSRTKIAKKKLGNAIKVLLDFVDPANVGRLHPKSADPKLQRRAVARRSGK